MNPNPAPLLPTDQEELAIQAVTELERNSNRQRRVDRFRRPNSHRPGEYDDASQQQRSDGADTFFHWVALIQAALPKLLIVPRIFTDGEGDGFTLYNG